MSDMSSQTAQLYQQVILEHNKKPRNFGKLESPTNQAEGYNPLCGDHLWVYLNLDAWGVIQDVRFEGSGCAISKASASMMTVALKGMKREEAQDLFKRFNMLLKGELKSADDAAKLGKLKIFSGIWQYPARVKCAALIWHAMNEAIGPGATNGQPVFTE